jgi:endonuclease-3
MNKKDKKKIIEDLLDRYIPDPQIPLYYENPFTLLMATLLSGQSTDAIVNKVTPKLFTKAKSPEEFLSLSKEEVQEIIRPCGLSSKKTENLFKIAKILQEKYLGRVPSTFQELEELPGVGHKTASVVLGIAFHKDTFPVDRHIHRLAKRWKISSGKNVSQTEKDVKKFFEEKKWNKIHLQMILFGRTYCQAKKHTSKTCPICQILDT